MSVWRANKLIVVAVWLLGLPGALRGGDGASGAAWSLFVVCVLACLGGFELAERLFQASASPGPSAVRNAQKELIDSIRQNGPRAHVAD
jgi:hypothetical protein